MICLSSRVRMYSINALKKGTKSSGKLSFDTSYINIQATSWSEDNPVFNCSSFDGISKLRYNISESLYISDLSYVTIEYMRISVNVLYPQCNSKHSCVVVLQKRTPIS